MSIDQANDEMRLRAETGSKVASKAQLPTSGSSKPVGVQERFTKTEIDHLLAGLLDNAFESIIVLDGSHCICVCNQSAKKTFGYTADEMIGQSVEMLMPVRYRKSHSGHMNKFARSEESKRMMGESNQIVGLRKDGTEFFARASISKLNVGNDNLFTIVMRDMTKSINKNEFIEKSNARFRDLMDSLEFGIVINQDGNLVFANRMASEMHGYEHNEFASTKVLDFVAPQDVPMLLEKIKANHRGETVENPLHYKGIRKDGTIFDVENRTQLVDWKGQPAALSVVRDISKFKQAEEAEFRLGRIIDQALNEVFVFDATTLNFVTVNRGARRNLGYSMEEMKSKTPIDIKPEYTAAAFAKLVKPLQDGTKDELIFETLHQRKDGTTYDAEVHLQLMEGSGQSVYSAFIRDITENKQAEAKLREAVFKSDQANRAKSQFLTNMSHELRTPLNAIIGFSQIMCDESFGPVGDPQYGEFLQEINQSGNQLLRLISDILDLAKIEAGEIQLNEDEIDVVETVHVCRRLIEDVAKKSGISLSTRLPSDLPSITADGNALTRILNGLLSNAIKFTSPGGQVTVLAEIDDDGSFLLRVADNGRGISEGDIREVLQPFAQSDNSLTRDRDGAGIGLPLVKSLVELHDGSFKLASKLGIGTIATIRLPSQRVLNAQASLENTAAETH